jgi:hypothetical protein
VTGGLVTCLAEIASTIEPFCNSLRRITQLPAAQCTRGDSRQDTRSGLRRKRSTRRTRHERKPVATACNTSASEPPRARFRTFKCFAATFNCLWFVAHTVRVSVCSCQV